LRGGMPRRLPVRRSRKMPCALAHPHRERRSTAPHD
jgi:hypothetical protein